MTILVTGATGQLGRLVIERLVSCGVTPDDIVAGARDPAKAGDLLAFGVRVAELDYDRPDTIADAIEGVATLFLISGNELGRRVPQHRAVIDTAAAAGVTKFVYTSAAQATTGSFVLAAEHKATEEAIVAAGIPAVILRNIWYTENYAADLARARDAGEIASSAGDGRVASATRADYAEAAAAVLLEDGHIGAVYELGGRAWNYDELAVAIGEVVGRQIAYRRLTTAEHVAALTAAGLDEDTAGFVASIDAGIAAGALDTADGSLERLLGRPATSLVDGLRAIA